MAEPIDMVLRRFAEYHDLEGAFGRRAVTERAKGILMERHSIGEDAAFDLLRAHSRSEIESSSTSQGRSSTGTRYCRSKRVRPGDLEVAVGPLEPSFSGGELFLSRLQLDKGG